MGSRNGCSQQCVAEVANVCLKILFDPGRRLAARCIEQAVLRNVTHSANKTTLRNGLRDRLDIVGEE